MLETQEKNSHDSHPKQTNKTKNSENKTKFINSTFSVLQHSIPHFCLSWLKHLPSPASPKDGKGEVL